MHTTAPKQFHKKALRASESLIGTLRRAFPSSHYAILSLFFFVSLELIFSFYQLIIPLASILLFVLITGILLIRSEEGGGFELTQAILPSVMAFGLTGFGLFLPSTIWLHAYFAISSVLFFCLLKYGTKHAYPTWNSTITLVTLFVSAGTILGWRFHLYTPILPTLTAIFILTTLLAMQSLRRFTPSIHDAWLVAMVIGFVLAQLAWTAQFLPLHFMIQSGILVAVYYTVFQLTTASYEHSLAKKDILEYILVGAIALFGLLITARWI